MVDFFYRKLKVYQRSIQLVVDVYALTKQFPSLSDISVKSNLKHKIQMSLKSIKC